MARHSSPALFLLLACMMAPAAMASEDDIIISGTGDTIDAMPIALRPMPNDPFQTRLTAANTDWMHSDVGAAWASGYRGQYVSITVVDTFDITGSLFAAPKFIPGAGARPHGFWTTSQVALVAPMADVYAQQWANVPVELKPGFNIFNASYGAIGSPIATLDAQTKSLADAAGKGTAVVVKAAGNDSRAADAYGYSGLTVTHDLFNEALKTSQSAIIVGALSTNGSTSKRAVLASYSNYAGSSSAVQDRFLTVGVDTSLLGIAGTSFAAPIVAGYAAVVSSKFTAASPTQVVNKLLASARTDTIQNYSASVYGRGEASLTNALAPVSVR